MVLLTPGQAPERATSTRRHASIVAAPLGTRRCSSSASRSTAWGQRGSSDTHPPGRQLPARIRHPCQESRPRSHQERRKMEAQIDIITLAVADLERALDFYRDGLGLESRGIIGTEFVGDDANPAGAIAMFELRDGLILSLYPRTELAKDAKVPLGPPKTGEFSIGHAVASESEVDALLAQAQAAGATLTDRPHDRPWGIYSGYFRDPDGHLWEILWNPRLVRPQE